MDILKYNRHAWDQQVKDGNQWTVPVTPEQIESAKRGHWQVVLTPLRPVPRSWFGDLNHQQILGLASGGGQQGPIMAAAGADVTIFDNSQAQLDQDRKVADRDGLKIKTIQGDMADLSCFEDESFDLIFHPCSNCFVPDVNPVWKECYRVLKKGGHLLSGVVNPVNFIVEDQESSGEAGLKIKYKIPYSDLDSLTEEQRRRYTDKNEPLIFGHSLEDQIGGQLRAGFKIVDFYEDSWTEDNGSIHNYINCFMAIRATK